MTKLENINDHISELREAVKAHLSDFLRVYGIMLNDLKVLVLPRDERMRELISLQAIGLTPIEAVRYYLALQDGREGPGLGAQRRGRRAVHDRRPAAGRLLQRRPTRRALGK